MHPRNIFNTAPDYKELAIKYPEFRKLCILTLNGKIIINLKNEDVLRGLTTVLLLHYFDLKLKFAPNSLIPTLPLRLNYILWIEDILNPVKSKNIHGIDIGCGSSCIYAILGAKKNNWNMSALESNSTSIQFAKDNIKENNLDNLVRVFPQINNNVILGDFMKSNTDIFDFCLCNPPFYNSNNNQRKCDRNPEKRKAPNNCQTGNIDELYCDGGEVAFVERIILESLSFSNRVKVFTSMLGHKDSLPAITEFLKSKNVHNIVSTKFHQGNTTRWAIGWTFEEDVLRYDKIKT